MSAKDIFIKKINENSEIQTSYEEQIKADILVFRKRMFELAKQVEEWLNGAGVKVETTEKTLVDQTIHIQMGNATLANHYNISSVTITNHATFVYPKLKCHPGFQF